MLHLHKVQIVSIVEGLVTVRARINDVLCATRADSLWLRRSGDGLLAAKSLGLLIGDRLLVGQVLPLRRHLTHVHVAQALGCKQLGKRRRKVLAEPVAAGLLLDQRVVQLRRKRLPLVLGVGLGISQR